MLTGAGATVSMGPASVTQGSMVASATLVSSSTSVSVNGEQLLCAMLGAPWQPLWMGWLGVTYQLESYITSVLASRYRVH